MLLSSIDPVHPIIQAQPIISLSVPVCFSSTAMDLPFSIFVSRVLLFVEPLPLLIGPRGIVFHAFCVYPLFVAAVSVVLFVVILPAGVVVATTTAYVAVVDSASAFVAAAVSFISLSDA